MTQLRLGQITHFLRRSKFILLATALLIGLCTFTFHFNLLSPSVLHAFEGQMSTEQAFVDLQGDPNKYTFMALLTPPSSENDPYFNATRVLVHRLKHHPVTKSKYPIHIMVVRGVDEWKIRRLEADGASIIMVDPISPSNMVVDVESMDHDVSKRYEHMFTKLRIFEQTQFDKLCVVDSDILILKNIDDIFDTPYQGKPRTPVKTEQRRYKDPKDDSEHYFEENFEEYGASIDDFYPYLLAAVSDRGEHHMIPPEPIGSFNAGMMLIRPSIEQFKRLLKIGAYPYKYENAHMMEQSLLNLAYEEHGWFPWTRVDPYYNGVWCSPDEYHHLKTAHGKFWNIGSSEFAPVYLAEWFRAYGEMLAFHQYQTN
ncbi:acetylglucosaminyltransferase [Schizosaccharomyces cryophilus OY26]|uniref:Acetylglucosaminyltransferase n=1 Tax=Schizosaccharomyces cryophilus (strain OY26 / ATCC MYA-4695 / CBS 11777 / NBRC 106824 / NRRL Y48691) TaxID=653667 RepID=S9X6H4_SCHCR|nr:acetylglucosaminyltransferase [Schizosaccharomyces cryophilus OY26]EPY52702.1 acetylglucosaminyltransferase [Schizosaccharomyces cryophilus OY26]